MPSFTIEHATPLSNSEAFTKVSEYLTNWEGLKKIDGDAEVSFDQNSLTGKVKGSKFSCDLKIEGNTPTKVTVNVNLHFLLTPFKGKIQDILKEKFTKILG